MTGPAVELLKRLAALPEVEAVALGGSRATGEYDERSDYDVYVYLAAPVEEERRRELLEPFCSRMEIGNTFWEPEDDVTLTDGVDMDIVYRDPDSFERDVERVVFRCEAANGYTTCMWHNLVTSVILWDRRGRLGKLQERCRVPYPQQLRENIIARNLKLLSGSLPSYDRQIRKAYERGDPVSVNHRVAEFLASYFDILFALNRMTHPGEKRMGEICAARCGCLPDGFEEDLNRLFSLMFRGDITPVIEKMVEELKKTLEKEGL